MEAFLGVWVGLFYLAWGLILLTRARRWAEREGAVQKLVPCAKGRAWGLLASVFCQLGMMIPLFFKK